jgi:iron-sulfur cluster assembly protein
MITLTESAAKHIRRQIEKRGGVGLRLGVKKVGCSGLAYTMEIAESVGPDEALFESHDAKVVVERRNLAFLDGTRVDYVRQGLNESFRFDNPNSKGECGCGESFSI